MMPGPDAEDVRVRRIRLGARLCELAAAYLDRAAAPGEVVDRWLFLAPRMTALPRGCLWLHGDGVFFPTASDEGHAGDGFPARNLKVRNGRPGRIFGWTPGLHANLTISHAEMDKCLRAPPKGRRGRGRFPRRSPSNGERRRSPISRKKAKKNDRPM